MKKFLFVSVLILTLMFSSSPVFAQAPTTKPAPATPAPAADPNDNVNVTVATSYIHFTNGLTGTLIEAVRPITGYWSLGYAQVQVPDAKAQFFLLGPRYDTDLSHIFKKASTSKLDLSLIKVYVGGGVGTRRDDLGNNPTFAAGFHGGVGISAGKLLGAQVGFNVSGGALFAATQSKNIPRVLTAFQSISNGNFAAGVSFTF